MIHRIKHLAIALILFAMMGLAGESDYQTCLDIPRMEMCG